MDQHYQSINAQLKHSLAAHYGCKGTLILAFVGFMTILYLLECLLYFTLGKKGTIESGKYCVWSQSAVLGSYWGKDESLTGVYE